MKMHDEETLLDELWEEEVLEEEESLLSQLGMEEQYDDSLNMMRTLAKNGDQRGILWMGMYYMQGDETEQDFAEACYWFDKSNDAVAKAEMAKVYEREGNQELARRYYQEAVEAEEDSEGTMKGLAHLSLTMLWLSEDLQEAEYNLIQAIQSTLPEGMESHIPKVADVLGRRLLLEKDYEACLAWTRVFLKYEPDNEDGKKRLLLTAIEGLKAEEGSDFQKNALIVLEELEKQGNYQASVLLHARRTENEDKAEETKKNSEEPSGHSSDTQNKELMPEDEEALKNRGICMLAYLGPLVIIPILKSRDDPCVRFHANQGLVLFLAFLILHFILVPVFQGIIFKLLYFVLGFFILMGLVNAFTGENLPLPLIDRIHLLK